MGAIHQPTLGCRQAVRHQTLTLASVGSNPAIPAKSDPLAQSAEQLPFKQWVRGSNPRRVTKKSHHVFSWWLFVLSCGTGRMNGMRGRFVCRGRCPHRPAPGQFIYVARLNGEMSRFIPFSCSIQRTGRFRKACGTMWASSPTFASNRVLFNKPHKTLCLCKQKRRDELEAWN